METKWFENFIVFLSDRDEHWRKRRESNSSFEKNSKRKTTKNHRNRIDEHKQFESKTFVCLFFLFSFSFHWKGFNNIERFSNSSLQHSNATNRTEISRLFESIESNSCDVQSRRSIYHQVKRKKEKKCEKIFRFLSAEVKIVGFTFGKANPIVSTMRFLRHENNEKISIVLSNEFKVKISFWFPLRRKYLTCLFSSQCNGHISDLRTKSTNNYGIFLSVERVNASTFVCWNVIIDLRYGYGRFQRSIETSRQSTSSLIGKHEEKQIFFFCDKLIFFLSKTTVIILWHFPSFFSVFFFK